MNRNNRRFIKLLMAVLYIAAIIPFCAAPISAQNNLTASSPSNDPYLYKIDTIMSQWLDPDGPGGVALVMQNGKPIILKGYGLANLECRMPVTPATVFNIASLDKQFTGFALAMLITEGRVALDDDIHRYLPELPDYGHSVTIRHLANHTGGLPDEFSLLQMAGYWTDDAITRDQSLKLIAAQRHLAFTPGEKWEYSNSGYTLIAEIIERITGEKLSDFCRRRIFEPLKMTGTRFVNDHRELIEGRACGYEYSDSGYMQIPVNYCPALYTTAEDLIKWIDNFESGEVGGPAVLDLMNQVGALQDDTPIEYGIGQFVKDYRGFKSYQHSGHIGAYTCFLVRFPEQHLAVACLSNAGYFQATMTGAAIADLFLPANSGDSSQPESSEQDIIPAISKEVSEDSTRFNIADTSKYVGVFQLESTLKILRIRSDSSGLILLNLSDVPLPLIPDIGGKFGMEGVNSKISFIRDSAGNITGLNLHMGKRLMPASKIQAVPLTPKDMMHLIGDYYSVELQMVCQIKQAHNGLVVIHARHPDNPIIPTAPLQFVGEQKWLRQIKFESDKKGMITGFWAGSAYARDIWFKKIS